MDRINIANELIRVAKSLVAGNEKADGGDAGGLMTMFNEIVGYYALNNKYASMKAELKNIKDNEFEVVFTVMPKNESKDAVVYKSSKDFQKEIDYGKNVVKTLVKIRRRCKDFINESKKEFPQFKVTFN